VADSILLTAQVLAAGSPVHVPLATAQVPAPLQPSCISIAQFFWASSQAVCRGTSVSQSISQVGNALFLCVTWSV
jgi:hypothetical protein